MKFNGSKCKILHLGKNNPNYDYTITEDGEVKNLEVTNSEKDLGVFIDPLLNFDNHISNIIKSQKAHGSDVESGVSTRSPPSLLLDQESLRRLHARSHRRLKHLF